MCCLCERSEDKRCSGVRGGFLLVVDGFKCKRCDGIT